MKPARSLLIGWILLFLVTLFVPLQKVEASGAAAQAVQAGEDGTELAPGNYCVSCHMPDDPVLPEAVDWKGSVGSFSSSPCPAVKSIQEELYYTERLMLAIDRSRSRLPDNEQTQQIETRLADLYPAYNQLFDKPVNSLDAFVSETQLLRFKLGKIYTQLNEMHDTRQQQWILIAAVLVSVFVLGSLVWGYWNARTFLSDAGRKGASPWKTALLCLIVFGFFALPIFQNFAPEDVYTEEEQEVQTVLDTAERSGAAAERAQARAWMLARVAVQWDSDEALKQERLAAALDAEQEARRQSTALWGQIQAAGETAGIRTVNLENASVVTEQLNAFQNRTWSLRMIALEWSAVDPVKAQELLAQARQYTLAEDGIYHDIDLAGIAWAWQALDPRAAQETVQAIDDPAIKRWAQRIISGEQESGAVADDVPVQSTAGASDQAYALFKAGNYPQAWEYTANIVDPYERARAQATIAAAWKNVEAAQTIEIPFIRDRTLRQLAVATGDLELAQAIETPSEKVIALAYLDRFEEAWEIAQDAAGVKGYPLVVLGTRWAPGDPQAALNVVDALESEADKAAVIREVAAVSGDQVIFDRALSLALAARVRGDALSPVNASLALAHAVDDPVLKEKAFAQAYETAERISIK